ncbi:hypothetical protein MAM1_0032d02427 [Mucor ambiguus]|uniref:Uncharacterized protein n=1 Tax=Mucor ambiguus TaxID=91626 RepID=A0A0C9MIP7_9FUNG|nr:hypothetical protein MAM1_0032d02427 [Mucor ambiguus]
MTKKLNLKPTPPNLNKLKGSYQLDDRLREKLGLAPNVLTGSVKTWSNVKAVVDEYLNNSQTWEAESQQFVLLLQTTVKRIIKSISKKPDYSTTNIELLLIQYCSSLLTFYKNPQIISEIEAYYKRKELERRAKENLQQAQIQSSATASAMVVEQSRQMEESSKKRSYDSVDNDYNLNLQRKDSPNEEEEFNLNEIGEANVQEQSLYDTDDPFNANPSVTKSQYSFVKNGKRFDYHTPSEHLISPRKPGLSTRDHGCLKDLFEIRLASDRTASCSPLTEAIYQTYRNGQYANISIKAHQDAISFLNAALNSEHFMDTRKLWSLPGESRFIDMMRHVLTDYFQSCRRSTPIDPSQERTFFCEIIVPILRHFGVLIGNLSGSWCEKQLVESRRVWLPLKDFRASGINRKLLDGILSNEQETMAVIEESSGYVSGFQNTSNSELRLPFFFDRAESTSHNVDDTFKQLKSTSDFLKYIMSKYKAAALRTMMELKIPCVTIIDNCLTLCITSVHDKAKWRFVEARTCIIPTTARDKKEWIKVFELLAFLKDVVEQSLDVLDQMENEALGYVELGSGERLVKDYFL